MPDNVIGFAVSSSVVTVCAVATGASFTPVSWITRLTTVVARPSLTVTAHVSVVEAFNALIAAALGVNV